MIRLAIIADDLTGALDAAAPFAGRGLRTCVALSPEALPEALEAEVVAVSTRSREISPDAARAAVELALSALPPGTRIFKKIDSRMKGNIAAELAAIPAKRMLVAPAIPDFGRVVRNGHVQGFGVDTPIAIAPLLGRPAEIPDTQTEADMAALDTEDALLVGARGLAEALAMRLTGRAATAPKLAGPRGLLVIGSRDPITMAQIAATGIAPTPAPNGMIPDTAGVLVQATPGATVEDPATVAANLARGIMALPRPDTLFLTGGATAEAVLSGLGIRTLQLLGECLPGLPVARAGGMTIVAKSGGFGDTNTLARIARMIGDA